MAAKGVGVGIFRRRAKVRRPGVGKLYRRLFVNDLKLRITILEERVHELEHINKQRETARQKRYNYKQGKKQNA
jgi:hypothetical protein